MAAFDGRIFIGSGDWGNRGPSANAGPVPVFAYDPAHDWFAVERVLPEEEINRFYPLDDELLLPGIDPRESWDLGNLYRRDRSGVWTKRRNLPGTVHTLALAHYQGRLFAGLTVQDAVPIGSAEQTWGSAVAVSDDGGGSWRRVLLGGWRIYEFLQTGDGFYAVDVFPGPGIRKWLDAQGRSGFYAPLYRYDGEGFVRRPDLDASVLFPDTPAATERTAWIVKAAQWRGSAVYIGEVGRRAEETPHRGLYRARDLRAGGAVVDKVAAPDGAVIWDFFVHGGRLYVLLAVRRDDGRYDNIVRSTLDARTWEQEVVLRAPTFARSFAWLDGHYYFGLGRAAEPAAEGCGPSDGLVGQILRMRAALRGG